METTKRYLILAKNKKTKTYFRMKGLTPNTRSAKVACGNPVEFGGYAYVSPEFATKLVENYINSGLASDEYTYGVFSYDTLGLTLVSGSENWTEYTPAVEVKEEEVVVVETSVVEEVANVVVETVEIMSEIVVKEVKSEYLISDMGNYERVKSINKVDRRDNVKEKDIEYATAWEIIEMIEEMHLESLSREIRQEVENSNSHDEDLKIKIELAEAKKKITSDKMMETRRLNELAKSQPINKIIKFNI